MGLGDLAMGLQGGFNTLADQNVRDHALGAASDLFTGIGTPEAQQYAALLKSDPATASSIADQFGGVHNLFGTMQTAAVQRAVLASRQGGVNAKTAEDAEKARHDQAIEDAASRTATAAQTRADAAAQRAGQGNQPKPQAPTEVEGGINKEYATQSKTFTAQQTAFDSVQSILSQYGTIDPKDPKATEKIGGLDEALIFAAARADNPNAVARATTLQELKKVAGVPGFVRAAIESVSGSGTISPAARQALGAGAEASFGGTVAHQAEMEDNFRARLARAPGANPANLTTLIRPQYRARFASPQGGAPSAPAPATPIAAGPPPGATHTGKDAQGRLHYADAKGNDLGLVPQ